MPNWVTTIAAFLFVIGIMILVHEWGHFVVARAFGIRVDIFSFGMGPRLWGRKRGDTDYRISAFPLGGYVKMAGDNPSEDRSGAPDEFLSKPRWQRLFVILAGPAMNIVTCTVLLFGLLTFVGLPHQTYLDQPPEVAALPLESSARTAGLQAGDVIVEVNGVATPNWERCYGELTKTPAGSPVKVTVQRGEETVELTLRAPQPGGLDDTVGYPKMPAVVRTVSPGLPADKAGLKAEDEIVGLNGEAIVTWPQLVERLRASNGEVQHLVVRRGEELVRLQAKPIQRTDPRGRTVWQIGMGPRIEEVYRRVGLVEAAGQSVVATAGMAREIFGVVGQLLTGRASVRELQGVIGIARASGDAVREGRAYFLNLMAVISMNLAILNLLPIPILDGGHVLLLAIEGALRRDLSVQVKERFVQVGLVFLLFIFVIVMYNDIRKLPFIMKIWPIQ